MFKKYSILSFVAAFRQAGALKLNATQIRVNDCVGMLMARLFFKYSYNSFVYGIYVKENTKRKTNTYRWWRR